MRRTSAAVAALALAGCPRSPEEAAPPAPSRAGVPEEIARLELPPPVESPVTVLSGRRAREIAPPIEIAWLDSYCDGGTVGIRAVDARGREVALCFDWRLTSGTPARICFGATHPTRRGAVLVPEGGADERALLGLLVGWLDANFARDEQVRLLRRESVIDLPERHYRALRLLRAFQGRRNVRETRLWIGKNVSPEDQRRLLRLRSPDGLSKEEETAWHMVQSQHGYPARRRKAE